jgi:hypothetical protein
MAPINQTFQSAPMGKRVILTTVISVVVTTGAIAVNLCFALPRMHAAPMNKVVLSALVPFLTVVMGMLFFIRQRSLVSQFKIEEDVLVVGKKKYPLVGATEVVRDSAVLKGAYRRYGNGGLGAITGSFKSKKLGKFYAFMTGTENAVVVRWPNQAVAVSPSDPEFFILSARKAAGLG